MYTVLLKETIAYYIKHYNPPYCVLLDAIKAIDRIDYGIENYSAKS